MKRIAIVIGLLFVGVAIAQVQMTAPFDTLSQRVEPGQLFTGSSSWVVLDATLAASTEPTDLGTGERTYLTVVAAILADSSGDGKITIYGDDLSERLEMSHSNAVRLRGIGITDGDSFTYQVYMGTLEVPGPLDCELVNVGQLVFTVGLQASITSGYEMADTLAITADSTWIADWGVDSPVSDLVAEAEIDMRGANILVLVPTAITSDCKLLGKFY